MLVDKIVLLTLVPWLPEDGSAFEKLNLCQWIASFAF